MASDRPKPLPGALFHFDASDPATYELDERGRVRAILGPDGKPVMVQDDPEKRPRLVKVGWCSAMRRRAMASKAVCWAYPPAFMADDATNLKPVPKLGHTKGERILAARSVPGACIVETMNVEPPCYICVRCGVVFAEEESDGG